MEPEAVHRSGARPIAIRTGKLLEPIVGTQGEADSNNATTPASIFTVAERNLLIDGQPLPRVLKHKTPIPPAYLVNSPKVLTYPGNMLRLAKPN